MSGGNNAVSGTHCGDYCPCIPDSAGKGMACSFALILIAAMGLVAIYLGQDHRAIFLPTLWTIGALSTILFAVAIYSCCCGKKGVQVQQPPHQPSGTTGSADRKDS